MCVCTYEHDHVHIYKYCVYKMYVCVVSTALYRWLLQSLRPRE